MINFTKTRPKSVVTVGFTMMLVLLAAFVALWISNMSDNKIIVQQLNSKQYNVRVILTVQYILNELHDLFDKLKTSTENLDKQRYYIQYKRYIGLLESTDLNKIKSDPNFNINQLRLSVSEFCRSQDDVIGFANLLIGDKEYEQAYNYFLDETSVSLENLRSIVNSSISYDLLFKTKHDISDILNKSDQNYHNSNYLVMFLGTFGLALGIFTIYVVGSTARAEEALLEQGTRIRALHGIISRPDLTFDQQIDETLALGCKLLGTEIGKVGRQDPKKNTSEFLNTVVMSDLPAKRGIILPLDKTFCNVTFSSPETIAISHVAQSEFKDHPAAAFLGMQSYIGCSINVHGRKFGTVNFSNRKPVARPFTDTDKDLVNLMGGWISVMMERKLDAEELQRSKDVADAANNAKSAFLANMSHEIRTPLTAILGYSDMLRDQNQPPDVIEQEVDSIIRSGTHLQRIINDILDLSKIEAGQLVIEEIEVPTGRIMHDIETIFGTRARNKGLTFEVNYDFPVPRQVMSDPTRLKQIIFNLCGNSLKFTEKGSINVTMGYSQDKKLLTIKVSDTGIGMNKTEIQKLFKPFSQADSSTTRKYGGTGLGLCIAKQLSQKLGGDIFVQSEKGVGTTFEFVLKVGDSEHQDLVSSLDQLSLIIDDEKVVIEPNSLSGHVLLVEDSPDNQDLMSRYLTRAGATVEVVDNGLKALQKTVGGEVYDLILMDIHMPIMDGITTTLKLRESGYNKPIVAITANALKQDRAKYMAAGMNDYLTKPIVVNRFYRVLKRFLKPLDAERSEMYVA